MSQMRKPEMEVIRFTESDIVVASNGGRRVMTTSFSLTGVNKGGEIGDGIANYNNTDYLINSESAVNTFISAMGVSNAGISNGVKTQSLRSTLKAETKQDIKGNWDGYYVYDPDAIWNNGNRDLNGVFKLQ